MKKVLFLFLVAMIISTVGYSHNKVNGAPGVSYHDSIITDTILIREGETIKALLQTRHDSLLQEIKTDVHLSDEQIKDLMRYGFIKIDSIRYDRFIRLPLPVVREKVTKQEIFYYLNEKDGSISAKVSSSAKEPIEWGMTVLSIFLPLVLMMVIGFLGGRKKKIKSVLLFCSAQVLFALLFPALVAQYSFIPAHALQLFLAAALMVFSALFGFKINFHATACCLLIALLFGLSAMSLSTSHWPYLLIITVACLISLGLALVIRHRLSIKEKQINSL